MLEFVEQQIKSSGGTDDDSKKHKEIALARKRIESLGISVASVHDMPMMKGISTLLDDELKTRAKPRKKHKFSEINSVKEPSGGIRYMCKPRIVRRRIMEDVKWLLRRCGLPILLLLFFVIAGVFCWGKQHAEKQKVAEEVWEPPVEIENSEAETEEVEDADTSTESAYWFVPQASD